MAWNRRDLAVWTAISVGVVALYHAALWGSVLDWDDGIWLRDPVLSLPWADAASEAVTTLRDRAWYPVLRLAWWLEQAAFGDATAPKHLVNVLLFAGCLPPIALLLRRAGLSPWAATVAVGLWAVHPTRVESVAWLTSLKDVLSLALLTAAALAWLPADKAESRPALATALATAAVLTKVAVAPVIAVLAVGVAVRHGRDRALRHVGPALAIGALLSLVGVFAFSTGAGPAPRPFPDLTHNVGFAFWQLGSWSWRVVWPFDLAVVVAIPDGIWPGAAGGALVVCAVLGLAYRVRGWSLALAALALLPLVPVSGAVSMPFWAADRHLLFPSLAASIALAALLERAAKSWAPARYAPILLAIPLVWATHQRIPVWSSSVALWESDMARADPHWGRGLQLGTEYGRLGRFADAAAALRASEAIAPDNDQVLARRILAELAADGDWSARDQTCAPLLQPEPKSGEQWEAAAGCLVDTGNLHAARDAAHRALSRGNAGYTPHVVLALAAASLRDQDPEPHLATASRISGTPVETLRAGVAQFLAK